jgi:ABC-type transport system involved in multi-copper enzyme maturation permease subunit
VTATTHTEIYRRFTGTLAPARPRFVPLYRARLRVARKRKLPLAILLVPPWISGIVFSFVVYTKFTVEEGLDSPLITSPAAFVSKAIALRATQIIQVHEQLINFMSVSRLFALLAIAWYGAGLICEDRRSGVHLLYFSRPVTRTDYFLAHYATACTFGALAVLAPAILICLVAVFSSPGYSFFTEKWDVIAGTLAYAAIYIAVTSLIVLAISSISNRKTYALAGVFGLFLGSGAIGRVVARLQDDEDFSLLSIPDNFRKLADWLLQSSDTRWSWSPWWSVAVLGGLGVLSIAITVTRLRRMEVVG